MLSGTECLRRSAGGACTKWNGFVLWSVRARARTAVHQAVGSPLGPPGVLTPARRRASSVLRSAGCVRLRGLRCSALRSVAPRGAVLCTPALRTPPRRTPGRPLSCRPHPPPRNPRPIPRQPHSGPPDSGHARSPPCRRPLDRSPAECSAVLRAKFAWQQNHRPQRAVFGDKRLSSESNPRPSDPQPST